MKRLTKAGAAVVLLHHFRKSAGEHGSAIRGSSALMGKVNVVIEFKLTEAGKTHPRRKLETFSHFGLTPDNVIIELTENGYRFDGSASDVQKIDRQEYLKSLLPDDGKLTDAELRKCWTTDGGVKPGLRTLRYDLEALFKAGEIIRHGSGKKGCPFKWSIKFKTVTEVTDKEEFKFE